MIGQVSSTNDHARYGPTLPVGNAVHFHLQVLSRGNRQGFSLIAHRLACAHDSVFQSAPVGDVLREKLLILMTHNLGAGTPIP